MKKRISAILLTIAMLVSMVPTTVFARDDVIDTAAELTSAISAADEGDTVTLGDDINLGTTVINITQSITLDLNGKTITSTPARATDTFEIYNADSVTIKNGTINTTDGVDVNTCVFDIGNLGAVGTVTLDDLTVNLYSDSASGYPVKMANANVLNIIDSSIWHEYYATNTYRYAIASPNNNKGELNISGDSFIYGKYDWSFGYHLHHQRLFHCCPFFLPGSR